MEKLLTTNEAADFLRHSRRTLEDWRSRRFGPPFIRARGKALYRLSGLNAWLDKNTRTSTSDSGNQLAG